MSRLKKNDLEERKAVLFGSVFALAQHLGRMADEALEPLGLTSRQWLLLAVLAKEFPGTAPTLSEAAARYGSSRQNVKQIALQLERRGFLRLSPDPSDRRALRLSLLPKVGVFETPKQLSRQRKLFEDVFQGLAVDEVRTLSALARRWVQLLTDPDD